MIRQALGFIAISTAHGAWGRGATLDEAVKNCKRNGPAAGRNKKQPLVIVATSCGATSVEIYAGVTLEYRLPPDHTAIRFQADF